MFMKFALQYLDENPAPVEINATYPFAYGDTVANLKSAAAGEHEEAEVDYLLFQRLPRKRALSDIAERFLLIAQAEKHHEERYLKLLENIETGKC